MSLSFGGMSDAGPKEALAGTLWWGFGEAPPSAVTTAEVTLRELRRALGEPPAPAASAQPAHASPPPAHVEAPVLTALARYADIVDDSAPAARVRGGVRVSRRGAPPARRRRRDAGPRAAPARCRERRRARRGLRRARRGARPARWRNEPLGRGRRRRPRRLRDARRARPATALDGCSTSIRSAVG